MSLVSERGDFTKPAGGGGGGVGGGLGGIRSPQKRKTSVGWKDKKIKE